MIETCKRPLLADERAEITDLIEKLPSPWRSAWQHALIIGVALVVVLVMGGVIWAIMSTDWSEMVMGSFAALPGSIGIFALLVVAYIGVNAPRVFMEDLRLRRDALAERPFLQALLDRDWVEVTRVVATSVIEIVLDEDSDYIYLFGLADGTTFYYESAMTEAGTWPSDRFEIIRGMDGDQVVWERVCATGNVLEPVLCIEEPWCYDGFERFIHRADGDDDFIEGVYNESSESLLYRLLGEKAVDDDQDA